MRTMLLAIFLLCSTASSFAEPPQTWITGGIDRSNVWISTFDQSRSLGWHSAEINVSFQERQPKGWISGWSFGIRKDDPIYYQGTYLTVRLERRFPGKIDLTPRIGIVCGEIGTHLDWSWEQRAGTSQTSYTHLFVVRNIHSPFGEIPFGEISKGILYPEFSLAAGKRKGPLSIEAVLRLQTMKFGMARSDFTTSQYHEQWAIVPSVGVNIGVRIWKPRTQKPR